MNPSEREELRSIITPALIANNQFGLTAHELNAEIVSLYGQPIKMPPGIPNIEALIKKEFSDEIIQCRRNDGVIVFKLIPKADTSNLLALVARQKKAKKPARGRASRPASSMSFRPSSAYGYSMGHVHPPPMISKPGGFASHRGMARPAAARCASSMGYSTVNYPPPSSFQMPAFVPPTRPPPPTIPTTSNASSGLVTAFNAIFDRYRSLSKHEDFELCVKPKSGSGDSILLSRHFPVSLADHLVICERFVGEIENYCKKPPPTMTSGRDSGISASPTFEDSVISVLPENRLPPIGSTLHRVSVVDLVTLARFLVQVTTPKGKARLLPCTLFDVSPVDEQKALAFLDNEIKSCGNQLDVSVKAHNAGVCEIDLAPSPNSSGDKQLRSQHSLVKLLIKEGCVAPRSLAGLVVEPIALPLGSRLAPNVDKFVARVTAVHTAHSIWAVQWDDLRLLNDIENQAAIVAASVTTRLAFEDLKEGAVCLLNRRKAQHRVRIEKKEPASQELTVWLIDAGSTATVTASDLLPIPKQFQDVLLRTPPLAFEMDLADFTAYATFEQAALMVKENIIGASFSFSVLNRAKTTLVRIESCQTPGKCNVNEIRCLILMKFLPSQFEVGREFRANVMQASVSRCHSTLNLFVRAISPFAEKILERIEAQIADLVAAKNKPNFSYASLKEGDELSGLYGEYYYRCRLLAKLPNEKLRVFFYDYGDEEEVTMADIQPLPAYLSTAVLPPQSTRCSLVGLPANGQKWREDATRILDGERTFDSPVDVKVISNSDGYFQLTMWTIDADKRKTCLNEVFKVREDLFERPLPRCVSESGSVDSLSAAFRAKGFSVSELPLDEVASDGDEYGDDDVWTSETGSVTSTPTTKVSLAPASFATKLVPFKWPSENEAFEANLHSFVAPDSFQAQLVLSTYHPLMLRLTLFYGDARNRHPVGDEPLQPGDMCVVLHEESYHRAQIILSGRHSYRVCLVDMGVQQIIPKESVFKLHTDFIEAGPFGFVLTLSDLPPALSSYFQASLTNFAQNLAEDMPLVKIKPAKVFIEGAIVKVVGEADVEKQGSEPMNLNKKMKEFVRPGKA